jgi:hypothetical protein
LCENLPPVAVLGQLMQPTGNMIWHIKNVIISIDFPASNGHNQLGAILGSFIATIAAAQQHLSLAKVASLLACWIFSDHVPERHR